MATFLHGLARTCARQIHGAPRVIAGYLLPAIAAVRSISAKNAPGPRSLNGLS
jgi:hypothetical protein